MSEFGAMQLNSNMGLKGRRECSPYTKNSNCFNYYQ